MMTVYKYTFPLEKVAHAEGAPVAEMGIPQGARIVHVGVQGGHVSRERVCLWAIVDTDKPDGKRRIAIHGTGHALDHDTEHFGSYLGSVHLDGGAFVFHLFDLGEVTP